MFLLYRYQQNDDLDTDDRIWLQKKSAYTGQSMSLIVRMAIRLMRDTEEKAFDGLLRQTSGTWKAGDALAYQQAVRSEWD